MAYFGAACRKSRTLVQNHLPPAGAHLLTLGLFAHPRYAATARTQSAQLQASLARGVAHGRGWCSRRSPPWLLLTCHRRSVVARKKPFQHIAASCRRGRGWRSATSAARPVLGPRAVTMSWAGAPMWPRRCLPRLRLPAPRTRRTTPPFARSGSVRHQKNGRRRRHRFVWLLTGVGTAKSGGNPCRHETGAAGWA